MPWTSRTLFGLNTLAGAVCTDAAQLRNSPSLLTPRRTFPLLDSSDSADQFIHVKQSQRNNKTASRNRLAEKCGGGVARWGDTRSKTCVQGRLQMGTHDHSVAVM